MPGNIKDFLLSKDGLVELSMYSLEARCALLKERFGYTMNRAFLSKFYKENRITNRRRLLFSQHAFHHADATALAHTNFVVRIANLFLNNKPLLFMDESTCTNHVIQPKCW